MKTISIAELHEHTEQWVRRAGAEPLIIADAGTPLARIEPCTAESAMTLRDRRLRPGFAQLAGRLAPKSAADDATRFISEERNAR